MIDLLGSTVVCNDDEALVVHVKNEILTLVRDHRLQSAQTKVSSSAFIDGDGREWGGSIWSRELTITARPMRPISPLRA